MSSLNIKQSGQRVVIANKSEDYILPIASTINLGGIKVGANLSIDANGVLSAVDITSVIDDANAANNKTYSSNKILQLISAIKSFEVEIVDELPTEDIDPLTIYFVPKTPSTHDAYDEFMYIKYQWEHIGSTEVDLSNYYTKAEVDLLFDDLGTASELNQTQIGDPDGVYLEASSVSVNKTGGVVSDAQTEFDYLLGNLGGFKFVNITQAEYDALPTPRDPQTVFIIVS